MELSRLTDLLEFHYDKYNRPGFVEHDPISIPHSFNTLQDKEIMGFFSAILAWGQWLDIKKSCKSKFTGFYKSMKIYKFIEYVMLQLRLYH